MFLGLVSWLQQFEDPRYPLLGPNIRVLFLFGVWQPADSRRRNLIYDVFHFLTALFLVSQCIDLYLQRRDFNKVLNNLSLTSISLICLAKCIIYVFYQPQWQQLAGKISQEELTQLEINDKLVVAKMKEYKLYARVISYMFWALVLLTNLTLFGAPLLKLSISKSYRENIKNGLDEYPTIMSCWFPFDSTTMPGYMYSILIQITMSLQGSGVLAGHDANAITIMTFMKGQLQILREKCVGIFDTDNDEGQEDFRKRIFECHRHHNFLLEQSRLFNCLLSPVMSIYVLICSMAICSSVVQFSSDEATAAQKLWAVQYTLAQIAQLFLFCWHANEVFIESVDVDQGVYASEWWKADLRTQKLLVLLSGKLNRPIIYKAGPFYNLNVPTFISILKGSYSFFTLFSQMQEDI